MTTTTAAEHAAMEAAGMDDTELRSTGREFAAKRVLTHQEWILCKAVHDEIETRNQARFQESLRSRRTR